MTLEPRHHTGFTLIELLVALTLLSFVFVILLNGLQFGTRVWETNEQQFSDTAKAVAIQNLLRRILSQARPLMLYADRTNPTTRVFFEGTPTDVHFLAPMPSHLGVGGLYELTLQVTAAGGAENGLALSWRLFRRSKEGSKLVPQQIQHRLLGEVDQIKLDYFGRLGDKPVPEWHEVWRNQQRLPELIRIRLKYSGDKGYWPELIVAPMVDTMNIVIPEEESVF
jgi:general secretion pathway protein J